MREQALSWIGPGVHEIQRRSAVWSHGAYTRYPFQANAYGLPPEVAYECVMGFVQARQGTRHRSDEPPPPKTFEDFCLSEFGPGISRHFMIPYNTRLWGVGPKEITADWCQRFVPVPSLEDVIAGAVGLADRELGYNVRFLYPRGGIGRLSEGLAGSLGEIELGRSPERIEVERRELVFPGERVRYDALINTAPLPRFVELLADAPAGVQEAAAELRATPLYYLDLALRRACGKPYHWIYLPEPQLPFYRVGSYSAFCPEMAPPGKASLYVELVDRNPPELGRLLPEVAGWLAKMGLIANAEDIVFARLRRIDHAYVIFDRRHAPALELIRPYLRAQRIWSCGRYGGWTYSAMGDALADGRDVAMDVAARLGLRTERERTEQEEP